MQCTKCGRHAGTTGAWHGLAASICRANAHPGLSLSTEGHALSKVQGGWRCTRCGMVGVSTALTAMRRARCPVRRLLDSQMQEVLGAEPWLRFHHRLAAAWRRWAAGRSDGLDLSPWPDGARLAVPVAAPNALSRLRWRPHWRLSDGARALCVLCGLGPERLARGRLAASPCPGWRPLRAAAVVALSTPGFAAALANAPAAWRAKAARGAVG